jgi:hypothetical protein
LFEWTSNPECQYEGAYIDDVCFYGQNDDEANKVWQGYNQESLGEFLYCEPQLFTFPTTWNAAEGCYKFHLQVHSCTPFTYTWPTFCIEDCLDISVACPTINDAGPYENIIGDVEICNVGDLNATAVPVTVDVYQALPQTLIDDRVEGGDLGYTLVNFVGTENDNYFHITEMISETPTHSWYWGVEPEDCTNGYADYLNLSVHGIVTPALDLTDALGGPCVDGPDVSYDLIYNLDDTYLSSIGSEDYIYGLAWFPDTGYYTFGGMYMMDLYATYGWSTWGEWVHQSWADIHFNPPGNTYSSATGWRYGLDMNCDGIRELGYNDIGGPDMVDFMIEAHQRGWTGANNWQVAVGFYISTDGARTGKDNWAAYPWGGFAFDNMYMEAEFPSKLLQTETTTIEKLAIPGFEGNPWCVDSCVTIDYRYDYAQVGKYIIQVSVPDDCCNNNNFMQIGHHVNAEVCAPSGYYRNGAGDQVDCAFHIKGSGYNNYMSAAYCGDEGAGAYANSLNTQVYSPCMDWSLDNVITINMIDYYEFELMAYYYVWPAGDFLTMWVSNNCCDEPCDACDCNYNSDADFVQIMTFDNLAGEDGDGDLDMWDSGAFWKTRTVTLTNTVDIVFTDTMCIKFKFITNDRFVDVGWELDYIDIIGDVTGPLNGPFMEDNMDSMLNWTCMAGANTLWDTVPQTDCWIWQNATADGYGPNLNDALTYYTDTSQTYNVDLEFDLDYNLGEGDVVYLEISTDNATWDILDTWNEGSFIGPYSVPINNWVPGPVWIRFRAVSNDSGFGLGYFEVCNLRLMGMLDLNAPDSSCTITGVYCDGVYTSDVTVTLTATDDILGVAAIYYKLDGGAQQVYTGPITVSAEGAHTVEYWAVDGAGNVESPHNMCAGFTIDKDTQAPTVTITEPAAGITIFGKHIGFGSKVIIIGGFQATATASDDSGIHSVKFYMDDVLFGESTGPTYTAYCGLKHMGAGVLKAVAEDNTGKTGTATLDVTYFKLF